MRKVLGSISLLVLLLNTLLTPLTYAGEYEEILEISGENASEEVNVEENGDVEMAPEFPVEEKNGEEESGGEDIENSTGDIVEEGSGEVFEVGSGEIEDLSGESVVWDTGAIVEELTGFIDELTGFSVELTGEMTGSTVTGEGVIVEEINYNKEPIVGEKTYNDVTVKVEALTGIFPEGTELIITPIKWWNLSNLKDKLVEEQEEVKEDTTVVAFDITFIYSGEEVQPKEGEKVKVTFDYSKNEDLLEADKNDNQEIKVYHIEDKDEEGNKLEDEEKKIRDVTNVKESEEEGIAVAEGESFSVYVVVATSGNGLRVIYDLNGGYWVEDHDTNSKTVIYTGTKTTLRYRTPSKTGYMFMGWYDETGTNRRKNGVVTNGMTVYAKWQEFKDLDVYVLKSDNNNEKYQYALMERNLGATSVYDKGTTPNPESQGYYYQWGNNYGFDSYLENNSNIVYYGTDQERVDASVFSWESPYYNSKFIRGTHWMTSRNRELWGDGEIKTNESKQGPCPEGYHIPSKDDWQSLLLAWGAVNKRFPKDFYSDFLIPSAGYRARGDSKVTDIGKYRYYTSSWVGANFGKKDIYALASNDINTVPVISTSVDKDPSHERSSNGLLVRCFKNEIGSSLNVSNIVLSGGQNAIISVVSGVVVSLQEPTKGDLLFGGFYTNEDYIGEKIKEVGDVILEGTTHLYAKWDCPEGQVEDQGSCVSGFKISFNATKNGGTTIVENVVVTGGIMSKTIDLSNYTAEKTGYYFVGWNTGSDARRGREGEKTFTESTELYAIFLNLNTYTFEDEEGNILGTGYYESGVVSVMSKLLTLDYYSDEIGDMSHYEDLLTLGLDDHSKGWKWTPSLPEDGIATGDLILHGEKLNKYTVTFNNDDGTDFLSYDVIDGTIIKEPVNHPEKVGYSFLGWYEDAELQTKFDFSSKVITQNTIIYPAFKEILCTFKLGEYGAGISINGFSGTQTEDCLTHFVIPSEIEGKPVLRIGDTAFKGDVSNAQIISGEIILPDTLIFIGSNSFYKNNISGTLKIPGGVTTVNSYAFRCNPVEEVIFGEGITTINSEAFRTNNCTTKNTLKKVTFPSTLQTIGSYAFHGQKIEGELIIPDSVTYIGNDAFNDNLITGLTLGNSVQTIGNSAFNKNKLTGELMIPNSVISIGNYAFDGNNNGGNKIRGELIIPDSVISIGESAFRKNQISGLTLGSSVQTIGKSVFESNKIEGELELPESLTNIGDYAFYNNNISGILRIPGNMNNGVVNSAFRCNLIEEVIFGEGITTISNEAFRPNNCSTKKTLKKVGFPTTLTTIGAGVFQEQIIEGELELPESLTSIGDYAFYKNNISGTLIIPGGITTINGYAFRCNPVEEVIFGEGITTISDNAFNTDGCTNKKTIKKVIFPSTLQSIGNSAFSNQIIEGEFIFPESLTTLGTAVFRGNNISGTLVVPGRLNGGRLNGAFRCNLIENVIIEEGITVVGEQAFYDVNKDGACPKGKHTIKTVQFPSSLTGIEFNAFRNNQLTGLILGENVETIGYNAFDNQYTGNERTLKSVILNNKLQDIGVRTFATNDIKSVYIPNTVEILNSQAFDQGNDKLGHKYITGYVTTKKSTLDYTGAFIKPLYQLYSYTFVNENGDILGTGYYPEILTSNTTKLIPLDYYNGIGNINDFTGVDELITSPEGYKVVWSTPLSENSVVTESLVITGSVEKVHTVVFKNPFTGDIVEYIENNGSLDAPEEYKVQGHTFTGWFSGDIKVDFPLTIISDLTLTGRYDRNSYTVNFYTGDSVETYYTGGIYEYETVLQKPDNPSKEGYSFAGWRAISGDNKRMVDFPFTVTGAIDLYAVYGIPVSIDFDANGGKFTDNSTGKTVRYLKEGGELGTKYSHTPNIGDNGVASENYENDLDLNDVVTIPGAESLKVTIVYQTESISYDWACVWEGNHPNYTAYKNCNERLGGQTKTTKEYIIPGDTVTFGFTSDYSVTNYGYYAVISDYPNYYGQTEIEDPINTGLKFDGWYLDQSGTAPFISPYGNEGNTVYAKWQSYTGWDGCYKYSTLGTDDDGNLMVQIDDYSGSCEKENLVIPSTINVDGESNIVTSLGAGSFYNKALSGSVTLPNSLVSIGNGAFSSNPNITSINIYEGVISIGNGAFQYNSGLKGINLPSTLKTIGDSAFYNGGLESIIIPDSVTSVLNDAFSRNTNLRTVKIGTGLEVLNPGIFSNCTGIESVDLGRVQSINAGNFYNTQITGLVIPDTVTYIAGGAFSNNTKLRTVKLGTGLKNLYDGVFNNCTGIETLDLGRVESIGANNFNNTQITGLVIPDSVNTISQTAFRYNQKLKTLKIGDGLQYLGDGVFQYCTSLETVELGNGLETISSAFAYDTELKNIIWGNNVKNIYGGAFYNTAIEELEIPDSVEYMGGGAFGKNPNLKTVKLGTGLKNLYDGVFNNCTGIETLDLGRVESIGAGNFSNTQITGLVIPNTVTSIVGGSFSNNTKLKTVKLGTGLETLSSGVFSSCIGIETLDLGRVESINAGNFYNTQITGLVIPDTVTYIEGGSFANNTKLKTVKFGTGLKNLGVGVFSGSFNIESLDLGKLETIDNYNFSGTQLTGLVIPDTVTKIYSYSFVNNTKLRTVTFGENVELISDQVFANSAITGVIIPAKLTTLGAGAFCVDDGTNTGTVVGILSENSLMTAEDVISAHGNLCLTVREKPHTVTYDAASHSGTIGGNKTKELIVNDNDIIQLTGDGSEIAVSERGYQFIGWTNVLGGTEPLIEEQTITSDITFYPIFKKAPEQRTALFSGNGATLSGNSEIEIPCTIPAVYNTGVQETTCSIITPNIQRAGYEILGYSADKNHKESCSITGNQEIQIAGDEVYYAITKKNLTAIFNKNGNIAQTKYGASETTEEDVEESCSIWNQETECAVWTPSILPSTDKISIGYTTSTTSSGENLTGENVRITLSESLMRYYAWTQSKPQEVKVNYVYSTGVVQGTTTENNCWTEVRYNGDENQTGCMISLPVLQIKTGYVAPKWYRSETEIVETDIENKAMFYYANSPIILTGKAEISGKISYVVKHYFQMLENDSITNKYALNQSYTDAGLSGEADTILILSGLKKEVEGFEYYKATVNGQPVNNIIDISQAIEYAETHQLTTPVEIKLLYTRNKYEYLLNQQTNVSTEGSTLSNANMYYGQTVILSGNVINDCYERSGWQGLPENVENIQQTSFTMPAGNVTITPIVKDKTYTIVFDKNALDAEGTVPNLENVKCSGQIQLDSNKIYTRNGYEFKEWNTNSDGTGTGYVKDAIITTALTKTGGAVVTLYAQWTANKYIVTFDANGGVVSEPDRQVTFDEEYGVLPIPTREGYTFSGWYTQAEGGEYVTGTTMVTRAENHTLYAQWKVKTYTITWKNSIGSVLETDENVPYGTMPSYDGEEPTSGGNVQYTYTFSGWTPATGMVVGDQVYTATYISTVNKYEIIFVDEDGTELKSVKYDYGTLSGDIEKPADPTKAADVQYTYSFAGWNPEVHNVTGAQVYTATYISTVNKYEITFVNEDGTKLQESEVAYGATPVYEGTTPTKSKTAQYTYTFAGWTPTISEVTKEQVYTATYISTVNKYEITFVDEDGTKLQESEVAYGDTPVYEGTTPTKSKTAQYTYTFAGWTPTISEVTKEQVYTATYISTVNEYEITFVDEDGAVLKAATKYEYDTLAANIVKPEDPTKAADAQYTYSFIGWDPEVHNVTGAQVYTAIYDRTINKYSVLWKNRDGDVLETDENVEYGSKPKYDGNTPLSGETVEYQYRFVGWNPSITNETIIEGDTVYTATYESIKRKYQITWKDYDDQIIDTTEVEYGVIPAHSNPIRTGYKFNTWDPIPVEVIGPTSYKATYTIKQYTVTPEKGVGVDDILGGGTYDYGTEIVLTGVAKEGYHFEGGVRIKEFNVGVPAQNITVKINAQPNIYYVHFKNNGGEGVMNDQAFTYDQEQALTPNAYIRNGYTFVSWTDGEGGIFKDKAVVKNLVTSGTINLIAQWIEGDVPGPTPPSPTPTPGGGGAGGGGGKSIDDKTDEKQHDSAEDKQQEKESKEDQNNKDKGVYTGGNVETLTGDSFVIIPETKYKWTEEELTAYKYAYKYGITTLAPEYAAMPDDYVQRGHMAKMVVNYALNVLHRKLPEKLPRECKWLDGRNAWESQEIKDYAEKSCALGIMGIDMKYFQPKKYVTRAQFGTIIGRLMWGKLTSKPYYAGHLARLKERGIMTQIENPENRIEIRKWAWLMFMRMEKYIM